tara:strand:+ start:409 stop:1260 length:852 start_codon:yes stop_codon:yes gene_type:complete
LSPSLQHEIEDDYSDDDSYDGTSDDSYMSDMDDPSPLQSRKSVKEELGNVLEVLERHVETGDIKEGAHLEVSNGLQAVHKAAERLGDNASEDVVIRLAVEHAFSLHSCYVVVNDPVSSRFIKKLLAAKAAADPGKVSKDGVVSDDAWLSDLMGFLIPEWAVDESEASVIRRGIYTMLRQGRGAYVDDVIRHLKHLDVDMHQLYNIKCEGGEIRSPAGRQILHDAYLALAVAPAFLKHIADPPYVGEPHVYVELREYCLDLACPDVVQRDDGFRKVLGLDPIQR